MGTYNAALYMGEGYKKKFRDKWKNKQKAFKDIDLKGIELAADDVEDTLYIACTDDKYELPIAVCGSTWELSQVLGMKHTTVTQYISKGIGHIYRIEVD